MTTAPECSSPIVVLTPIRPFLMADQPNTLHVLVRVQGPKAPPTDETLPREPRALALVIDSSGSMRGRPLAEAKRCAEHVVNRLHPKDRVAVVQFDQRARLLWPAVELNSRRSVIEAIQQIQEGGATALHEGWVQGVNALADLDMPGLRRVILLSDGEANRGECDPEVIAQDCANWAEKGITTSTYGLGKSFNEDLMVAMAHKGGGSQYFGHSAKDLMATFEQELSLIDLRCMTEVRATLRGLAGIEIEVLNELLIARDVCKLPDVAFESEAWALLRLTIPAEALADCHQGRALLEVSVSAKDGNGEVLNLAPVALSLPIMAHDTSSPVEEDELVLRRMTEVAAAQALDKMREAMRNGELERVQRMLQEAKNAYGGNEWVQAILESMERMSQDRVDAHIMAKEMKYSSMYLKNRIRVQNEISRWVEEENELPAFLQRHGTQGTKNP